MKYITAVFLTILTGLLLIGCTPAEPELPTPYLNGPSSAPSASPVGSPPA